MDPSEILAITRSVMARTFRVEPQTITESTRADDILRWDSLGHLTLVLGLEKHFNVSLPVEPMRLAQDVSGVVAIIAAALARPA